MSFRKPCHMPFRKLIPPFTLTAENFIQGGTSELLRRPLNVPQNETKKILQFNAVGHITKNFRSLMVVFEN